MKANDGRMLTWIQCPTFKNCWKVVANHANENEDVVCFFMVCVDGVIIEAFANQWKCKIT
eukprot:12928861-Prorocentrum_lima.AAC.1